MHNKLQHVKLTQDYILVECIEEEAIKQTKSGIYIAGEEAGATTTPNKGTVLATGPGYEDNGKLRKMSSKVGDVVMYGKFNYDKIKIDAEEYLIMKDRDILAVIDVR